MHRTWRFYSVIALSVVGSCLLVDGLADAEEINVDVALVLASDVSPSMDPVEKWITRESYAAAVESPEVVDAIRKGFEGRIAIAYIEFASTADLRLDWTLVDSPRSAAALAAKIRALEKQDRFSTNIAAAISLADYLFTVIPYRAPRLVLDIAGDGIGNMASVPDPLEIAPVRPARAKLLARGATINGMPLVIDPDDDGLADFYADDVAGGPGHFSLPITRIEQMPVAMRQKLVMELF